jgi:hypothetical protein
VRSRNVSMGPGDTLRGKTDAIDPYRTCGSQEFVEQDLRISFL